MLRITIRSVIIRGRTTSYCFLVTQKRDEAGLCNVGGEWTSAESNRRGTAIKASRLTTHSAGVFCGLPLSMISSSIVRVGKLLLFSLRWTVPRGM